MIGGHDAAAIPVKPLAMLPGDAEVLPNQAHGGDAAQTDDDLGVHQGDLPGQPGVAGLLLHIQRVPVPGRAALDDVGNIHLLPVQVNHFQHIVQQFSCRAHKRDALQIFLLPGPLADEHDFRLLIAHAENQLVPGLRQGAAPAAGAVPLQALPSVHHNSSVFPARDSSSSRRLLSGYSIT